LAQPLGITYPGAFYHAAARGNEGRNIFLSQADCCRRICLSLSDESLYNGFCDDSPDLLIKTRGRPQESQKNGSNDP
jgi:hypothetical protein